ASHGRRLRSRSRLSRFRTAKPLRAFAGNAPVAQPLRVHRRRGMRGRMAKRIGIIGGGPAGLMAAEAAPAAGHAVTVFDAMPTVGRKLLMAGKSGLNLTHAEPHAVFVSRFGAAAERLRSALDAFTGEDVRAWAAGLGIETFVGSSGRVFPVAMKASPLLRARLARPDAQGVTVRTRPRWGAGQAARGGPVRAGRGWGGFEGEALGVETAGGRVVEGFDATVLAVGGGGGPKGGSDGAWVPWLEDKGVAVNRFRPANCGFDV